MDRGWFGVLHVPRTSSFSRREECTSGNHVPPASFCPPQVLPSILIKFVPVTTSIPTLLRSTPTLATASDQIKDRRLQWDPAGLCVISAWGQAEFQGGRMLRAYPTHMRTGLVSWATTWPGPNCKQPATSMSEEAALKSSKRITAKRRLLFSPTSGSEPYLLFMLLPFQHTCACTQHLYSGSSA